MQVCARSRLTGRQSGPRDVNHEVVVAGSQCRAFARGWSSAVSLRSVFLDGRVDRYWHNVSGCQVAEPTMVRSRAMTQQLGQHAQSLVGEILVDEGLLPSQSLCCTAGGLVVFLLVSLENLRV